MTEQKMIRGKRKWWTLWLSRYPDRRAYTFAEILQAGTKAREKHIEDIMSASSLSDILKRRRDA